MLAIGVADYFTGFEVSFLVFYFLPVALAVTAFGWQAGVVTALASVTVWLAGDFAAGAHYANPLVPWWNATIALGTYLVLIALLARLLATQREMEERIRQRTAALTDEIAERERLEKVILEISERERRSKRNPHRLPDQRQVMSHIPRKQTHPRRDQIRRTDAGHQQPRVLPQKNYRPGWIPRRHGFRMCKQQLPVIPPCP